MVGRRRSDRRCVVKLSPILAGLAQYPFARLDDWRADARARGIDVIDFGVGDPREVTPAFIREALVAGISDVSSYPRAAGLPELRAAIADWIARRYGVDRRARQRSCRRSARRRRSSRSRRSRSASGASSPCPSPRIRSTSAERCLPAREFVTVPLREETGWLPDLDSFDRWDELALFWVCYPNNPTAATAPLSFYEELAGRAREHGFLVCSDEAYSELWFGERAGLRAPGRRPRAHGRVQHALEALVDDRLPLGLRLRAARGRRRPARVPAVARDRAAGVRPARLGRRLGRRSGTSTEMRAIYRRKRDTLLPALESAGFRLAGGDATFFLWLAVDEPSERVARRLLERGLLVAPGSFFGPAGEGYVRLALVPTQAECELAARLLTRPL